MRRAFIVAVLVVTIGTADRATAGWPWKGGGGNPTPGVLPGTAGMRSWAGVPGLGGPVTSQYPSKPGTSPVIGSVSRTGHLVHPFTGRTRYSGTAYDPALGRFSTFHFRQ